MDNILVCDDDREIVDAVEIYLASEGYNVIKAYDGPEALEKIEENSIDLMLIDIMMPKMDGIHVVRVVRAEHNFPIIILSAKSEDGDKILGLNIGADDYITKPFSSMELLARVRSQLRRYKRLGCRIDEDKKDVYTAGGLTVDDSAKEVYVDGEKVSKLTPMEYNILLFLIKNKGRVYSTEQIYENIWKEEALGAESTVAVHIRHIREKIEIDPGNPRYLKVVWGIGYKLEGN